MRAEYLYGSYSNGRDLPDDAKRLVLRAVDYEHELGSARIGGMLLMNGTDHQMPQPWLGRVVAEANAIQDDYEFVVTSLPEYLPQRTDNRARHRRGRAAFGRARQSAHGRRLEPGRHPPGCAAAERSLERRAEPLSALFLPAEQYPHALFEIAWRKLVLNSAHDSSCACSHDEVVDQVAVRYAEARQIGDGLTRDAVHELAATVDAPAGATVVVNPTAGTRSGLVEARVPGTGPCHFVDADGRARRDPTARRDRRRGLSHDGQRREGALGARPHARHRVRGAARSRAYEVHDTGSVHDIVLREAARR